MEGDEEEAASSALRRPGAPLARLLIAPILASETAESAESEFFLVLLTLEEEAERAGLASELFFLGWMMSLPPSGGARSEDDVITIDRRRWPDRMSAAARCTARTLPATPSSRGREDGVGDRGDGGDCCDDGDWE